MTMCKVLRLLLSGGLPAPALLSGLSSREFLEFSSTQRIPEAWSPGRSGRRVRASEPMAVAKARTAASLSASVPRVSNAPGLPSAATHPTTSQPLAQGQLRAPAPRVCIFSHKTELKIFSLPDHRGRPSSPVRGLSEDEGRVLFAFCGAP